MLEEIINSYEELKKYVFIIQYDKNNSLILSFNNQHFYHLLGLQHMNIDMYFPKKITSKVKRYKYIKENIDKFDNIINNQIKRKHILGYRIKTFSSIINLLRDKKTRLYNLKYDKTGSLFDGDYGLYNTFNDLYCLLGIKRDNYSEYFIPQSWMVSNRKNRLIANKPAKGISIKIIPIEEFEGNYKIFNTSESNKDYTFN